MSDCDAAEYSVSHVWKSEEYVDNTFYQCSILPLNIVYILHSHTNDLIFTHLHNRGKHLIYV